MGTEATSMRAGRAVGGIRRALTLVESIATIVVVSIAVPPIMISMRDAATRVVDPIQSDRARWLAAEKLEDIIADRHSTTRGYAYVTNANYAAEASVSGFANFARSVSVAETGADLSSAGTGYKRVTVTVSWSDARGVGRSLAVATVVTDY